jgi:poly(A) polymerase
MKTGNNTELHHPVLRIIGEAADRLGVACYVIGGYVRDLIMKRESDDIDIVALGSGIELAEEFALQAAIKNEIKVFRNFGTAMVNYHGLDIEFVGARKESYSSDSRNHVVENGTLEDDQNRRDFTINALAISLNSKSFGKLIDPFNGLEDIGKKILRTPLDPSITFSDDPLRMMRAIRFAAQLKFDIDEATFSAICNNKERIFIVSGERIAEELNKIICSSNPSEGIRLLENSGLLELIFPQLLSLKGVEMVEGKGHKDNYHHTLKVLDNVSLLSDNLWLRWAALLHDIGKPSSKKFDEKNGWTFHAHDFIGSKMVPAIFKKMKLPLNEKMKYVQKLVFLHLRPIALVEETVTDSAIRRLLFDAGDDIDDLMILCKADITSKNQAKVKTYLKNFELVREKLIEIEEKDKIRNWQPPITGEIIMQTFNLLPCKEVGIIKNSIKEAILDNKINNNFEDAYNLMIEEGKKLGFNPIHEQ